MNLTEKQLKVQEAILLRLHPGKSLEEARRQEPILWCILSIVESFWPIHGTIIDYEESLHLIEYTIKWDDWAIEKAMNLNKFNIIWLPPPLSRVLQALGEDYVFIQWWIYKINSLASCLAVWSVRYLEEEKVHRKLLNDDGSDATLRDQSQETQDAIDKLLWVE